MREPDGTVGGHESAQLSLGFGDQAFDRGVVEHRFKRPAAHVRVDPSANGRELRFALSASNLGWGDSGSAQESANPVGIAE